MIPNSDTMVPNALTTGGGGGGPILNLTPVAYSTLPSPTTPGQVACINDGNPPGCADGSCTTWGTSVTAGGGTQRLLLYANGNTWTLIGIGFVVVGTGFFKQDFYRAQFFYSKFFNRQG